MNAIKELEFKMEMPVQYVPRVGPKMAEKLGRLGIHSIEDLIQYYPRAWEDRRSFTSIRESRIDQERTFFGEIVQTHYVETPRGFAIAKITIRDHTGDLLCKWVRKKSFQYDVFKSFKKDFLIGSKLIVYGRVVFDADGKSLNVSDHEVYHDIATEQVHINRIVPIYPLTEGIRPRFMRNLTHKVLHHSQLQDPLPKKLIETYNLLPYSEALKEIHFPGTFKDKEKARNRLAFQELFMIQVVLALAKRRRQVKRVRQYEIMKNLLTPFRESCGFEFTKSQKKVINEIFTDLQSNIPMNRLLQGDVGSGKTIVALSAMLLACENKGQSVLMAPTEILAEQHYITVQQYLKNLPVRVALLTGSIKSKDREKILEDLSQGRIDILIGTHAVLEKDIHFKDLALVVIDEQHRFGVKQRLLLTSRKPIPDVLVMTATPIPRTLALGIYGDLDVSTIDELPPGRQTIATHAMTEKEAFQVAKSILTKKQQVYIVYPLVEESKNGSLGVEDEESISFLEDDSSSQKLKSAIVEHQKLKDKVFKDEAVGLLYGKLPSKEKEEEMLQFKNGNYSILVSTTVIEVGIDVPNATLMIIQNAERFGLSTLHQLRGRVGRGTEPSSCILVTNPKTPEAKSRIEKFLTIHNGFELAEADLEFRGPGELFGTSQHGLPELKISNLIHDQAWMKKARDSALDWLEQDPDLSTEESQHIRNYIRKHYSNKWHLANIA